MIEKLYTIDEAREVLGVEREPLITWILKELPDFQKRNPHHLTQSEIDRFDHDRKKGQP